MKKKRITPPDDLVDEPHADDGVDPRYFRRERQEVDGKKLLRMCSQVARTVAVSLTGECDDPLLNDLQVVEVIPAPDASRLCIKVRSSDESHESSLVEDRLEKRRGYLRSEVARVLNRKRAPELEFLLVHSGE